MNKLIISSILALGITSQANAADTASVELIKGTVASDIAKSAMTICSKQGYAVSAAVVDRFGNLLALSRNEMAGPHTVNSASQKAFTSASMGRDTDSLAKLVVDMPTVAGLANMDDRLLLLTGGLPISIDGFRVAGIGVGGAPGGHLDAACAEEAIKAVLK